MRRTGLCLLAIVVLCSGQVCTAPPAGDPGPEDLGLPIPGGTYAGEVPVTARALLNSLPLGTTTEGMPVTQAFGSDGMPLTDANEPMGAGYTIEEQTSDGTTTMTVRSIDADGRSVIITYDASMSVSTAGQQVLMTGTATRTYTPKVDASLELIIQTDIGAPIGSGAVFRMVMDGRGSLTK